MGDGQVARILELARPAGYYDIDAGQCISAPESSDRSSSYYNEGARRFIPLSLFPVPQDNAAATRAKRDFTPFIIALLGGLNPMGCGGKLNICLQFEKSDCVGDHVAPEVRGIPQAKYGYNMVDDAQADINDVLRKLDDGTGNSCLATGLNGIYFEENDPEKGSYTPETQIIRVNPALMDHGTLYGEAHKFVMFFRLYHELGHHVNHYVFYHFCPESDYPIRFSAISWDLSTGNMKADMNPDVSSGDFLNEDAVRNSDEDFAVSFAYYVWMPGEFRRRKEGHPALEAKYEFMKSLFGGREFHRAWDDQSAYSGHIALDGGLPGYDGLKIRMGRSLIEMIPHLLMTNPSRPDHSCARRASQ
ncbi:MAG: hypothetical protein WC956_10860 [bacterium]